MQERQCSLHPLVVGEAASPQACISLHVCSTLFQLTPPTTKIISKLSLESLDTGFQQLHFLSLPSLLVDLLLHSVECLSAFLPSRTLAINNQQSTINNQQ
jgi:hypothetical protein